MGWSKLESRGEAGLATGDYVYFAHSFACDDGPHSIADWFAGSTLQPFLERLGDDERCEFLARYRKGLKEAYPVQPDGRTLFAYPRLFIVAVKTAEA